MDPRRRGDMLRLILLVRRWRGDHRSRSRTSDRRRRDRRAESGVERRDGRPWVLLWHTHRIRRANGDAHADVCARGRRARDHTHASAEPVVRAAALEPPPPVPTLIPLLLLVLILVNVHVPPLVLVLVPLAVPVFVDTPGVPVFLRPPIVAGVPRGLELLGTLAHADVLADADLDALISKGAREGGGFCVAGC
jgi:hypothetical protein